MPLTLSYSSAEEFYNEAVVSQELVQAAGDVSIPGCTAKTLLLLPGQPG